MSTTGNTAPAGPEQHRRTPNAIPAGSSKSVEIQMTTAPQPLVADENIAAPLQALIGGRILALREQRVMLDADLAELYGVQTKVLVQAVKRNMTRFPQDFMFQLSTAEFVALRSQTVTSNTGHGALCIH